MKAMNSNRRLPLLSLMEPTKPEFMRNLENRLLDSGGEKVPKDLHLETG
jgi:hypothetical protein